MRQPIRNIITKQCQQCGCLFEVHQYRRDTAIFCSNRCQTKHNAEKRVGKSISSEVRLKIAQSHMGICPNDVTREKLSLSHKGQHSSPATEFQKGMTTWNKGLVGYRQGSKNPNWKGGISSRFAKIKGSPAYKTWRIKVFKRDWFTCQMPSCGYKGRDIQAHHIKKITDSLELILDKNNGITLCVDCHNLTRGKEALFENLFNEIVKIKRGDTSLSGTGTAGLDLFLTFRTP